MIKTAEKTVLSVYSAEELKNLIQAFRPFPVWAERERWRRVDDAVKKAVLEAAEPFLTVEWTIDRVTERLDYFTTGKRCPKYSNRCQALVCMTLAECVEGNGRYLRQIADLAWTICETTSWVPAEHTASKEMYLPGHETDQLPDVTEPKFFIDLISGETAAALSWTVYFLKTELDKLSPQICDRIVYEVHRRVFVPFLDYPELFWWSGFQAGAKINNWNPWINSNIAAAALILARGDMQCRLLAQGIVSTNQYYASLPEDGGCDEGPGYWLAAGSALFDFYELLYLASDRKINVFADEKLKQIGRYIARVHIADRNFVNIGDSNAKMDVPAELIYRFGVRTDDELLRGMGISVFQTTNQYRYMFFTTLACDCFRKACAIFRMAELKLKNVCSGYAPMQQMYIRSLGVAAARSKRLYLCVKGGHNGESHNHNDVGNFLLYVDGEPALIDIGVETYTKDSFSEKRYEIWTMRSAFHNVPMINGIEQAAGEQYRANNFDVRFGGKTSISLDLEDAYPPEAGLQRWHREFLLSESGDFLTVRDCFACKEGSTLSWSFVSCCKPEVQKNGNMRFGAVEMECTKGEWTVETEYHPVGDIRLKKSWNAVYRTVYSMRTQAERGAVEFRFCLAERQSW